MRDPTAAPRTSQNQAQTNVWRTVTWVRLGMLNILDESLNLPLTSLGGSIFSVGMPA